MEPGIEDAPQPIAAEAAAPAVPASGGQTVLAILLALSCAHLLNDSMQALLPAIYPMLKKTFLLNFAQVGLLTFTVQLTASILQPIIGLYTDRKPMPYSLALGMGLNLCGVAAIAFAPAYPALLAGAGFIGIGAAIFHPEASRIARLASGGRHGFAQSLFQVGGNAGSAMGPLMAALIVIPFGQRSILWFSIAALLGIVILARVGRWYHAHLREAHKRPAPVVTEHTQLPRGTVIRSILVLLALVFSKYIYLSSMVSYYTFYLIERFHLSIQQSQLFLFAFLAAAAAGTIIGGPIGDRFGRKVVIWFSILGVAPFTLALPYVGLVPTILISLVIGLVLASAFSTILVYATEIVPGRVGLIAGLFFGFGFGIAGIGAAVLGKLADITSITFVFKVCSYLPLIGLLTSLLPNLERQKSE